MRLRVLLASVLVAATLPVVLGAGPASAHDVLVSSDPAADASVSGDLDRVTLTLSEPPLSGLQSGIVISVTDAGGSEHARGDVSTDGNTIGTAVDLTDAGAYQVRWRSVSVDGHPISGEYAFTSTGATAPAPSASAPSSSATAGTPAVGPSPSATATEVAEAQAPAAHQHGAATTIWLLAGLVVVALLAVLVTRLVQRRRGPALTAEDDR
ncbi:copper resistance protein CopC [Curtobacterium sp. Csp1]|uniref:copper resistance CopC family protein n=1 Tax=Curtobacterium sp. Csp1 TaxID=2495429 RepID=UPI001597528F|nr:copper resistance CopC family protein [Curtobacterium sp. Csp1]QKS19094.1 copper resistance protein CopC [Curtobacterium sp. Csp1]